LTTFYDEQLSAAARMINVDFPSPNDCDLFACPHSQPAHGIEKLVADRKRNRIFFRSHRAIESCHLLDLGLTIDTGRAHIQDPQKRVSATWTI
jgi:hypothetical protein